MIGKVILADGRKKTLPTLLNWRFVHTDGSSSDSFSLAFCYDSQWEPLLKMAVRFEGWENSTLRFYGIVDEYEVCWDENGLVAEVHGRGLAGLLMDNQVAEKEYYWVRLGDILRNYVTPYGIKAVNYERNYRLTSYAVDYGECCWDALCGFCLWAAGVQPRFLPDGTLVISSGQGTKRTIGESCIQKTLWRQTRYGVYSTVAAKYVGTYYEPKVNDSAFLAMGGCATHRMTIPRKNRCRAGLKSALRTLQDSKKEFRILEVTVPELFYAQPVDVITAELTKIGVTGNFQVVETENSLSSDGSLCKLRLRQIS